MCQNHSLADSLDLEMPDLPDDDGTTKIGGTIIRDGSFTNEKEVSILFTFKQQKSCNLILIIDFSVNILRIILPTVSGKMKMRVVFTKIL
jgi:hypothetical protein